MGSNIPKAFFENLFSQDDVSQSPLGMKADSKGIGIILMDRDYQNAKKGEAGIITLHQFNLFRMLLEQGVAVEIAQGKGIYLKSEDAVLLDNDIRHILGLPAPWIGSFFVRTHGITTQNDFNLYLDLVMPSGEKIRNYKMDGPILSISNSEEYLPDQLQWKALSAVTQHQQIPSHKRTEYNNLRAIHALINTERSELEIDLTAYKGKETIAPDRVGVSIQENETDGSLQLFPSFGCGIHPDEISETIHQLDHGSQSLRTGQKILLLDQERLKAVHSIITNRNIPASQKKQFFENPSLFLDTSVVDLDVGFSLRVKGIGPFQHAYFGATDESGINWFEEVASHEKSNGTDIISPEKLPSIIADIETLVRFQQQIRDARKTDAETLVFEKKCIDISDAKKIDAVVNRLEEKFKYGRYDENAIHKEDVPERTSEVVLDIHKQDTDLTIDPGVSSPPPIGTKYPGQIDFNTYKRRPYPHQQEGIRWLLGLTVGDTSYKCALLADDMGLGKTYTALVWMGELFKKHYQDERPVLVVAPLSLLEVWKSEVTKTYKESPFDRVITLQSDGDLRQYRISSGIETRKQVINLETEDREESSALIEKAKRLWSLDVKALSKPKTLVLTTYQVLRDYQFSLCAIKWSIVAFDEAQNIKNPNTRQSHASKAVNANFKLLITGTPVENSLRDFWCLFDVVQTGFLGEYQEFRSKYIVPILKAKGEDAPKIKIEVGENLRQRVGGLMLRRIKEEHLKDLPEKIIHVGFESQNIASTVFEQRLRCTVDGAQKEKYESILNNTGEIKLNKTGRGQAFRLLRQLRDVSLHPALLGGGTPPAPRNKNEAHQLFAQSGKLKALLFILDEILQRDEKALIFAINKKFQEFLAEGLKRIYGIPIEIINGDTKVTNKRKQNKTRTSIISHFEACPGFGVLIMSPIAAGTGLTIVGANHVVHLERHWNPAKEAQATDRVYRIGQKKNVNVYIPILAHPEVDSFDHNLAVLLDSKSSLKDAIVTPDEIQPEDFVRKGVFGNRFKTNVRISIDDVQSMSGEFFEALIADIYTQISDEVILTPVSGDKGCDVVVISSKYGNKLIQCKKTIHTVLDGDSHVREIHSSKVFYEDKFQTKFDVLEVFTNAKKYTRTGKKAASMYKVELKTGKDLKKYISKYNVFWADVLKRDNNRPKL